MRITDHGSWHPRVERERKEEATAFAEAALHPNRPAVQFDELLADRQAEM
jgi:hypothetical protein